MSATIEERLQKVEDHLRIQQLIFRYAVALDTRQWKMLDDVFAQDCVFEYGDAGMGSMHSLAEFVASCAKTLGPLISQHTMSSPTIEIDGDKAHSHTYGTNQHVDMKRVPNHQMLMAGWYDDDWVRTDGRWLVHRRRTMGAWASGNPAVVGQQSIRGAEAAA